MPWLWDICLYGILRIRITHQYSRFRMFNTFIILFIYFNKITCFTHTFILVLPRSSHVNCPFKKIISNCNDRHLCPNTVQTQHTFNMQPQLPHTEHFGWFSMTSQDLVQHVEVLAFNTVNATFVAHSYGILYKLSWHFASNVPVLTNANMLQIIGYDQNSSLSSNHSQRWLKNLSH